MFNIGGGELLVILLVALIVLGPQRLPEAARKVGSVLGEVRRMATGFQNEIKTAFDDAEIAAKGEDPADRLASRPGPNKKQTSAPPMRRVPRSTAAPASEGPSQETEIEGSSTAVPDPASPPPPSPDAPPDDGQSDAVA